ncbi:DUF3575 domain-containing protein [Salegentibacter salegens]|uniref:Outer membrane protein beta-barrel domain-containing protein n=1 Tax=Salegentibacter salegens TaxID=143223 RepID=A0A1M7HYK2_9FLAO|nr:DUF3575 domain-containing protein [Salegentibacter salegens]PRX45265.1 uncharacterized protein DUF3575 [Salegentibacter salegens]SHM33602.1 Protein of unknown function [Salegentibacter salegens]
MKKLLLLSFCLFTFSSINAQDQASVEDGLLSINILTPGLEYEYGLTNSTTLDLRAGSAFGYRDNSYFGEDFGIYPTFNVQYRYYYNLEKRLNKGKNIKNNSANYIALSGSVQSGKPIIGDLEYSEGYFGTVGPVWGLQRYYGSGFKLDLNLGAGYGFNESGDSFLSLLIGIRLGWRLSN